jgi:hypothetical protein
VGLAGDSNLPDAASAAVAAPVATLRLLSHSCCAFLKNSIFEFPCPSAYSLSAPRQQPQHCDSIATAANSELLSQLPWQTTRLLSQKTRLPSHF